jgi:LytTr DNA-binding domain
MARSLAVTLAAGLFLALVGALGTGQAPLPARLIYWTGLMVCGAVMGVALASRARQRRWFGGRAWRQSLAVAALMTVPMSALVWLANSLVFGAPLSLLGWLLLVAPVCVVCTGATAVNFLADARAQNARAQTSAVAEPVRVEVKFLERLPPRLAGAELYAVEAEDHYLRLHTSKGQDLILMRLADAVDELVGLEGARTHRSWWVARAAVVEAKRSDGRGALLLASGVEAPVSRTYAPALREAGWF